MLEVLALKPFLFGGLCVQLIMQWDKYINLFEK